MRFRRVATMIATLAAGAGLMVASPAAATPAKTVPPVQAGSTIYVPDILLGNAAMSRCTVGYVKGSTAVTAAHCVKPGQPVYDAAFKRIGTGSWNKQLQGVDLAGIDLGRGVRKLRSQVYYGLMPANAQVGKYGATTMMTYGHVARAHPTPHTSSMLLTAAVPFTIPLPVNTSKAMMCSQPGDSGGPVVSRATGRIVGVVSSIDGKSFSGCHRSSVTYYTPLNLL